MERETDWIDEIGIDYDEIENDDFDAEDAHLLGLDEIEIDDD